MQVILIQNVHRLGAIGEVVKVRGGYARNFLIPKNIAVAATKKNIESIEQQKAELELQNQERRKVAEALGAKIAGSKVVLIRQAGEDGRLFGSVTPKDIVRALSEKNAGVELFAVIDKPIKTIGIFPLKLVLHTEVSVEISANVARSEAEAFEAEQELEKAKEKAKEKAAKAAEAALATAEQVETAPDAESEEKPAKKVRAKKTASDEDAE